MAANATTALAAKTIASTAWSKVIVMERPLRPSWLPASSRSVGAVRSGPAPQARGPIFFAITTAVPAARAGGSSGRCGRSCCWPARAVSDTTSPQSAVQPPVRLAFPSVPSRPLPPALPWRCQAPRWFLEAPVGRFPCSMPSLPPRAPPNRARARSKGLFGSGAGAERRSKISWFPIRSRHAFRAAL